MQLKHDPPAELPTSIHAPTKTTATATAATILFPLIRQILSPRPRRVPRPRVRGRFSSHLQTALYAKPRLLSIAPANLFIHRRNPLIPPTKRGRPPVAPPIKTAKKPKHVVRRPLLNLCCRGKRKPEHIGGTKREALVPRREPCPRSVVFRRRPEGKVFRLVARQNPFTEGVLAAPPPFLKKRQPTLLYLLFVQQNRLPITPLLGAWSALLTLVSLGHDGE